MNQNITTRTRYKLPMPTVGPLDEEPIPGWPIDRVFGAAVYHDDKVIVTCQTNGTTAFPKTHAKPGETEVDTVIRCIKHETDLDVRVNTIHKVVVAYPVKPRKVNKEVIYYLATPTDPTQPLVCSDNQLVDMRWLNFMEVDEYLYYPFYKRTWRALHALIDALTTQRTM